mgnify:FL=1
MAIKFLLHSKQESTMASSWNDALYCSILKSGSVFMHYNISDEYGSTWFPAIRNIKTPKEFVTAFQSFERLEHWGIEDLLPAMWTNYPLFADALQQYIANKN